MSSAAERRFARAQLRRARDDQQRWHRERFREENARVDEASDALRRLNNFYSVIGDLVRGTLPLPRLPQMSVTEENISDAPRGGTFRLILNGETSDPIPINDPGSIAQPALTAENIYDAVRATQDEERVMSARVEGYNMHPRGPSASHEIHDEAYPDQGTTLSWTHNVNDQGVFVVTMTMGDGGTPCVTVGGAPVAPGFEWGEFKTGSNDPRLEPVDIIDQIDKVLAEEDHPEHVDAVVNWQIGRYNRDRW